MPIKIPKQVRILARTFRIEWINNLSSDKNCSGEINYNEQKIRLQPNQEGTPRHHEGIAVAFFHELIHGVLIELNYRELGNDEKFVEQLANVIYASLRDAGMLVEEAGKGVKK